MQSYSTIKIIVILIVFLSIVGNLGITVFICLSDRIKTDIYKIIILISISQFIVYTSVLPYGDLMPASNSIFCTIQGAILTSAQLITFISCSRLSIFIYNALNNKSKLNNHYFILVSIITILTLQVTTCQFTFQLEAILINSYERLSWDGDSQSQLDYFYCNIIPDTSSFYLYISILLFYSLVQVIYIFKICFFRINSSKSNINIAPYLYLFPILTSFYFIMYLVQMISLQTRPILYIIFVFLNLTPGLTFVVVFLLVIRFDNYNHVQVSQLSDSMFNINAATRADDETKISDRGQDENKQEGCMVLSESVLEYKKQRDFSVMSSQTVRKLEM